MSVATTLERRYGLRVARLDPIVGEGEEALPPAIHQSPAGANAPGPGHAAVGALTFGDE